MTIAKIHEFGGPKTLTAVQQRVADKLVADGVYVYAEKVQGKGIVSSFRDYLSTGDAGKISPALYRFLTLKAGFIAHYDLGGFRSVYRDPADLLDRSKDSGRKMFSGGVMDGPVQHSQSVYRDGMTDNEIWEQMAAIAASCSEGLHDQRDERAKAAEIELATRLAAKHGLTVS